MKPLFRWTIGPVKKNGFLSLEISVQKLQEIYSGNFVICHNNLNLPNLTRLEKFANRVGCILYQQKSDDLKIESPRGVSWKLYPARLNFEGHEIFIDNDLIIEESIPQIDQFLQKKDYTIMLEDIEVAYGRYKNYIKDGLKLNSGLFGIPPLFDLESKIKMFCNRWEQNATGPYSSSFTFDEQGLVAFLLSAQKLIIIPESTICNCEHAFREGKGFHFVGLNRKWFHESFAVYLTKRRFC